ncbi:MAG: phospho-N-acetylmuramoyl-pentapeptide-transferase [Burkholderia sp.]|nr:phospho-N-acetylmuramoyl-pentapeptide-transferase [Burkholderia sp.]
MLLALSKWLQSDLSFLHLFMYLTFRAIGATITALVIGLVCGPCAIRNLVKMRVSQSIPNYRLKTHLVKDGTPTMGGVLILISIIISTLIWGDLTNRFIWAVIFVILSLGVVGWVDDYRKIFNKDCCGMSPCEKYFWQSVITLFISVYLAFSISETSNFRAFDMFIEWVRNGLSIRLAPHTDLLLPFFKSKSYPLGIWGFITFTYFVIIGTSNAVNLTDGLDGLVIMPVVFVGLSLGVFAYVIGNAVYSKYLLLPYIPGAGELLIFCSALGGAGLAFLWYNTYPAKIFMGDVGALPLGGVLGTVAVIVRQEIVLFIMGGIFVVETISVIIQVMWFSYTKRRYLEGRRIFKMAPLHHHFELSGWKETHVSVRFWIITLMLCLFGLSTLKFR